MTLGQVAAVPLRWDEELRGVLVVELEGQGRDAGAAEIRVLGELAALASAAFRTRPRMPSSRSRRRPTG